MVYPGISGGVGSQGPLTMQLLSTQVMELISGQLKLDRRELFMISVMLPKEWWLVTFCVRIQHN